MQRVLVTVRQKGAQRGWDLELPAELEMARLCPLLAEALHLERDYPGQHVSYELTDAVSGRLLLATDTLASAEVWDGGLLDFACVGDGAGLLGGIRLDGAPSQRFIAPAEPSAAIRNAFDPVRHFRPLGTAGPDAVPAPPSPVVRRVGPAADARPVPPLLRRRGFRPLDEPEQHGDPTADDADAADAGGHDAGQEAPAYPVVVDWRRLDG